MSFKEISFKSALNFLRLKKEEDIFSLFLDASKIRRHYFGNKVTTCSIINAKCGFCPENCAFCAQSAGAKSKITTYPLVSENVIFKEAEKRQNYFSSHFGIVASGRTINRKELSVICKVVRKISTSLKIKPCASLGILEKDALKKLRDSGLFRYHHNLETAESFFRAVCTTKNYREKIDTIRNVKEIGLSVCCGGIFGLGESLKQRVEFLEIIRSLDVDSVAINFLNPIRGTGLEKMGRIPPFECLKIIAVARLMMPDKNIRVCGGREYNLGDLQSWIFLAGADAVMTGGYLVTSGRDVRLDLKMIGDMKLELEGRN